MAVNTNGFESGQASGTAITTGNSGGAAGRAFDNVTGTVTYDTTRMHGHTRSARVDMAGGTVSQVRWLDGAPQAGADSYLRMYVYLTALPSQNLSVAYVTDHLNAFHARVRIRDTGVVDLIDSANAIMATTIATVAIGQWVRLEAKVTRHASTGSAELRLFNDTDSSTPTETLVTTAAWNTGANNAGGWRFGGLTSSAAADVVWIDDIATSDAGWIGPAMVVGEWTGTAGEADAEIAATPTPGNWLVACVAWRVVDGSAPQMAVGDPPRNLWHLLYSNTVTAHATHTGAQLQVQVWACPVAQYEGWDQLRVHAAAQAISASDAGSVLVHVAEVAGMTNGHLTVDSVTVGTATAAGSLSIPVPAPAGGAPTLVIAAAAIDDTTKTVTVTGAGYTAMTQASRTGPDVELAPAYQAATGATTASWSVTAGTTDWAGVAVALRQTGVGPVQPNPNWPITRFEVGIGHDMETPLPAVRYTDQTSRLVDSAGNATVRTPRGIPYTLGTAQSAPADLVIRNDDGAYSPRPAGNATASAPGTTSTIQIPDASATNIHPSDFFYLRAPGGDLKELAVFQVLATANAAGTTTITFARADGTGVAAAATATGDVYEGIGVDLFIPYRMTMMWGGKWYPIASGWLGELPQTWANPAWGTVGAVGMDALGTLTAAVPTALAGEIMRRGPAAHWPLDDPSGSTAAQDVAGLGAPPLVQTTSKFGAGAAGEADFGVSTQRTDSGIDDNPTTLLGDPGSAWGVSGLVAAELASKGFALVASGTEFPPIADGLTIFGVSLLKAGDDTNATLNGTLDPTVFVLRNTNPGAGAEGAVIKLSADHTPGSFLRARVVTWDKDTYVSTNTLCATNQILGASWRTWALVFDRTTWTCYASDDVVGSGVCDLAAEFTAINIGGEADQFSNSRFWNGSHARVAIFPRKLTAMEITALSDTAQRGRLVDDTTSRRVARKLHQVGWRGPRIIPASDVAAASEGADGGTVAEFGANTAADDDGMQFLDAAGQLQWRGHVAGYYQSPRATLGEDTVNGEIPFLPGQRFDFDPTYVYHQIKIDNESITNFDDLTENTIVAIDPESRRRYGPRTMSLSTRLQFLEDAFGLAHGLLTRYSRTRQRVGQVVINPAAYPAAWGFCLGVETGDLVVVNRRPLGAPMISTVCRVLKVTPTLGPGVATFALELEAAPDPVVVLGDPVMGSLADRTIGW